MVNATGINQKQLDVYTLIFSVRNQETLQNTVVPHCKLTRIFYSAGRL